MTKKTLLSWSSGKDSAWALHLLRQDPAIELLGLFTVTNEIDHRASMHATRLELLRRQANAACLPIQLLRLPASCTNEESDAVMGRFMADTAAQGIEHIAFGDLFLEDIRRYREKRLKGTGVRPLFPLWQIPTEDLAEQMLAAGVEGYVSSVDLEKLPARFAGRKWSWELIQEFPEGTDPCGENGEIHTVVVAGPMFREPIPVKVGETVERGGFAYADIIPME